MNYTHTIAGVAAAGADTFGVTNPATAQEFERAPAGTPAEVEAAVRSARDAFPAWAATPHAERVGRLMQFADAIDASRDSLARLLTTEQGKPLARATDEISNSTRYLRSLVELPMGPDLVTASDGRQVKIHHRPLGVVGAITPWNVPVLLGIWKIGHALVTGNTMVLKPAPTTPLTTLCLGALGRGIFPPGVLNVVAGGDAVGAALIAHPDVAKISFTGSVAVGRKVAAAAAASLKRVTLELGGNDAAIVLDDADAAAAAPAIFAAAFTNAGQACMAIKRLYVHDALFDEFVDRLKACADATKVGNGLEPGVHMGPVQNSRQFASIRSVVDEARFTGCAVYAGAGAVPECGYFFAPQIAIQPAADLRLVREETFGPVLPIMRYRNPDEAVASANASPFGLSGSVWTSDVERGRNVVEQLEVGSAWVNRHVDYDAHVPFGGMKCSGMGRENSVYGLRHYTELQAVYC
jgi:acyl-CoA reductase-like NAD-dependent aldehyde dehydrogenase